MPPRLGVRFRPDGWLRELSKPSWTPPNIAFPIAWGILYLLMAIAAWRIYIADESAWRTASLAVCALQLLANAAWSWLFFWKRNRNTDPEKLGNRNNSATSRWSCSLILPNRPLRFSRASYSMLIESPPQMRPINASSVRPFTQRPGCADNHHSCR
ncbi:TspO/MBR family protein [Halomonas sp. SpR8]|uniref:TspO/MBR family protein n=1 Tax=Halomonas sp. SpR8 TaxID=3050463 RepID=UPI0027E40A82|nr:TspO/MBR family protein [Halomonas sp. SpR8]MDQ7728919.1 TspO/MBR family protein [Halomonas sp. SpR8]